eukprot:8384423-Karenia_brevis.AAC.1
MDEDEDEELEEGKDSDQNLPSGRGSYSTIATRSATVQHFLVSGLSIADYVEMHPNLLVSTHEKWMEA